MDVLSREAKVLEMQLNQRYQEAANKSNGTSYSRRRWYEYEIYIASCSDEEYMEI